MIFLIFNFHPTFSPLLSFQIFIYLLLWDDGRLCYYFLFICFTINRKGFVNQRVAKPTKVISHVFLFRIWNQKSFTVELKSKKKYFYFVLHLGSPAIWRYSSASHSGYSFLDVKRRIYYFWDTSASRYRDIRGVLISFGHVR